MRARFVILAVLILVGCIFGWMAVHAQEDSAPTASALHAKKRGVETRSEANQVKLYDADPAHPWNRLHSALFVRTTSAGKSYGQDELDPLLWLESKYLLIGKRHKKILAILDEFASSKSDTLIKDPIKRAVLQRDLWSIFDWLANPDAVYAVRPDDVAPEQRALEVRLAKVIRRLALSSEQIKQLPDNYAAAIAAKAFSTTHNAAHPEIAFLPADLFKPSGPWVILGDQLASPAPLHIRVHGRSAFFVFMNLPGGRAATEAYLKQLAAFPIRLITDKDNNRVFDPKLPQFPVGTQLALVREMYVIDDKGKIQPTHLIESIQVRVFRDIPKANPAKRSGFDGEGKQDFHELRLARQALFEGKNGGLHAVTPEEPEFVLLNPMPVDPFEQDDPSGPWSEPILHTCTACHSAPGIHSMQSLRRDFVRLPAFPHLEPDERNQQEEAAMFKKWEDYSWGLLEGLWETR